MTSRPLCQPRNTPTCVGKTKGKKSARLVTGKHPHVRGEDGLALSGSQLSIETPPRAWGRRGWTGPGGQYEGNTPTCVGKTGQGEYGQALGQKHPHVRGEDPLGQRGYIGAKETPPRAWGRLRGPGQAGSGNGNTPTCVGKTLPSWLPAMNRRKHPHVRGEDRPRLHPWR